MDPIGSKFSKYTPTYQNKHTLQISSLYDQRCLYVSQSVRTLILYLVIDDSAGVRRNAIQIQRKGLCDQLLRAAAGGGRVQLLRHGADVQRRGRTGDDGGHLLWSYTLPAAEAYGFR